MCLSPLARVPLSRTHVLIPPALCVLLRDSPQDPHAEVLALMEQTLRFAFKCHQFAGGFDQEATHLFVSVSQSLQTMQEQLDGPGEPGAA